MGYRGAKGEGGGGGGKWDSHGNGNRENLRNVFAAF